MGYQEHEPPHWGAALAIVALVGTVVAVCYLLQKSPSELREELWRERMRNQEMQQRLPPIIIQPPKPSGQKAADEP